MRIVLLAALVLGMTFSFSTTANAQQHIAKTLSFLDLKLGAVPTIRLNAQSFDVTLTNVEGGHAISESASVFQTDSFVINSAAFTGLPSLTGLKLSLHAGVGNYGESATYTNAVGVRTVSGFGGFGANAGNAVLQAGGFNFTIGLGVLGSGGTLNLAAVLANVLVVTGAPFNTGPVNITGLSSNIVHVPSLGVTGVAFTLNLSTIELLTAYELTTGSGGIQENGTVIIAGTNNVASSRNGGTIKMVSPYRIKTGNLAGNIAGSVTKYFFLPEPGSTLLLVAGAAGLAVVGRRRMRK